jgi:alpha-mannosidase
VAGQNAVTSAVKRAEDGGGLIVRLYNPSDTATIATLTLPRPVSAAHLCNLREQPLEPAPVGDEDDTVAVELPPKKIATVRLVF